MRIKLNSEPREIAACTLAEALVELGYGDKAVATALNGAFVAKEARPETVLTDGDQLEVLAPMQGG